MKRVLEKFLAITKKQQKSCVAQNQRGPIEKHRKHFTTIPSPEQFHAKRDPLRGILSIRERKAGEPQQALSLLVMLAPSITEDCHRLYQC